MLGEGPPTPAAAAVALMCSSFRIEANMSMDSARVVDGRSSRLSEGKNSSAIFASRLALESCRKLSYSSKRWVSWYYRGIQDSRNLEPIKSIADDQDGLHGLQITSHPSMNCSHKRTRSAQAAETAISEGSYSNFKHPTPGWTDAHIVILHWLLLDEARRFLQAQECLAGGPNGGRWMKPDALYRHRYA